MSTKRNVRLRREYLYRKQVAGARARARHSTLHAARHAAGAMLYSPCCTHPHTRQLETNERVVYDKKRKLKQAIESGKPIPTELREEEAELRHQIEMDDANTEEVSVQCLCTGRSAVPAPPGSLLACVLTGPPSSSSGVVQTASQRNGRRIRAGRGSRPKSHDQHIARSLFSASPIRQGNDAYFPEFATHKSRQLYHK